MLLKKLWKTNLNENFLVQPNNKILDYRILKSYKEDQNYIVEVEAIVGNLDNLDSICSNRKVINVKEFKGNYIINTNTPSWAYSYIDKILYQVRRYMLNNKSISYTNYSSKKFDFNFDNFDKSFDYKTLVNGSDSLNYGDYIYSKVSHHCCNHCHQYKRCNTLRQCHYRILYRHHQQHG